MSWRDELAVPAAKRQRCFAEKAAIWETQSSATMPKDQNANQDVACPLCLEDVPRPDAIRLDGCRHAFCCDCLTTHFRHNMREHSLPLRCPLPRCTTVVSYSTIKRVLTGDDARIMDQLDMASLIPEHLQFYCPYPDCAALMEVEAEEQLPGCPSQCAVCQRAVCSACRSAWHEGMTCARHQALRRPSRGGHTPHWQLPQQLPISRQASLASAFGRAVNVYAPGPAAPWDAPALGSGASFGGHQLQIPQLGSTRAPQYGHGQQQQQQWQSPAFGRGRQVQFQQQQQQQRQQQQWQGPAFGGDSKQAFFAQQQAGQPPQPSYQQQWQAPALGNGRQPSFEHPTGQQRGMWPVF